METKIKHKLKFKAKEIENNCLPTGWNLDKDFKEIEFEVIYKTANKRLKQK